MQMFSLIHLFAAAGYFEAFTGQGFALGAFVVAEDGVADAVVLAFGEPLPDEPVASSLAEQPARAVARAVAARAAVRSRCMARRLGLDTGPERRPC